MKRNRWKFKIEKITYSKNSVEHLILLPKKAFNVSLRLQNMIHPVTQILHSM